MSLETAGKAALEYAVRVLGQADAERFAASVTAYAEAVDIAAGAKKAWINEGKPFTAKQTNGVTGVHPGYKAMMETRREVAKCLAALKLEPAASRGGPGRPVGAVSAPDRVNEPPRITKLRAV